jgi:sec-independent protein translocase protein TatC
VDDKRYTLTEHLADLRRRLGRAIVAILACALASLALADDLFTVMSAPLKEALPPDSKFVVVSPLEYVLTSLEIALTFGIVLASPYVIYQLWLFVAPGLYEAEQRTVRLLVGATSLCFAAGAAFCYLVVFPVMMKFLLGMMPPDVVGMYSVGVYFGFFLRFILAFGVAFELPVAMVVLCWLGVLEPARLAKARRYAVVLSFVAAALLTPTTDPYTQTLMAVPLIVLYEVGLWAARAVGPRKKPPEPEPKPKPAPA